MMLNDRQMMGRQTRKKQRAARMKQKTKRLKMFRRRQSLQKAINSRISLLDQKRMRKKPTIPTATTIAETTNQMGIKPIRTKKKIPIQSLKNPNRRSMNKKPTIPAATIVETTNQTGIKPIRTKIKIPIQSLKNPNRRSMKKSGKATFNFRLLVI